ncbi:hypothetical protein CC85DRAFT_328561 [Cutaneotrichosporon oleaginosum]|uniref:GST C-terminal domain-containing protein n=1 Tax=Cutaneotrichosporon oleaginosum TaxID=879819 RepID=A0A0J0XLL9_9TREE|nr:uncharacterized protein CC85DRAFT_328561 [Cutaneotrichosporon oleaginosum]KLT41996.1 hypothetical protein CC85DRAFT_328561 [Cutaneotrichosporon oleaginosum]TXT14345.1 hypothetical protein COLE_00538 [Cutaneotrichosporon oleaginosum]
MTNSVTLYGLTTKQGTQTNVSPFAWKTAVDLGLLRIPYTWDGKTFEEIRTSFEAETGVKGILVPAIKTSDGWVYDSFKIAQHLDNGTLFPDGEAAARKIDEWADSDLRAAIMPLLVPWLYQAQAPTSQAWFLKIKLGGDQAKIDMLCQAVLDAQYVDAQAANVRSKLQSIEEKLRDAPFLAGERAGHADASVWGWYASTRAISIQGLDIDDIWRHESLPRVAAWVDAVQKAAGVTLALP